jgi:ATP-dependent DNA ligase
VSNRNKPTLYSITSSARVSSVGGISRLSAFAVFRLITPRQLDPSAQRSTQLPPCRCVRVSYRPGSLPTSGAQPPSGETWLHEIKHDGFRVIARKSGKRVTLYSGRATI